MAEGIVYLRPSADISVGHSIYPSSLSNGYLAINEAESDGSATYIYQTVNNSSASIATSQFALSGDCRNVGTVLGGSIFVAGSVNLTATNRIDISIIISGTEYSVCNSYVFDSNATLNLPENCLTAMNNANSLSDIQLKLYSAAQSSSSKNTTVYFTQIYLELDVEATDIGIHHKVNGEWKAATAAYKKTNGAWAEISADECKAYLANAPIVTK